MVGQLSALVTGGGSGIGRGIALGLARRGFAVALAGRRSDRLEAVCTEARDAGAPRAAALPGDLADADTRRCLLARAEAAFDAPPDVLVHNAALLAGGPLADLNTRTLEQAVAVNVLAPLEITRQWLACAPEGGAVVFVASLTALAPLPGLPVYSATKAALRAFALALAHDEVVCRRGVRVLTVFPPATATDMTRGMAAVTGGRYPLADAERVGERIAAAAVAGGRHGEMDLMSAGERALARLHRLWPGAARAILHARRADFLRAVTQAEGKPGA